MDLQLRDPRILKCNTLQLLLKYPNGVSFGNFLGAFYQVHRYHPDFSRYGYNSLRHLLDDMEVVVVEGTSCNPVMKLANDFNLNGWTDEGEENGLDRFEEEDPRMEDGGGRGRGKETAAAALAKVLAAVTNLLKKYESGLQIQKIQKFLLTTNGIDLEKFSITKGYKDTLMFLEEQIPNLNIKHQEKILKCVVQLSEGSSTPASFLDSDFSDNSASSLSKNLMMKKTDLTATLEPVLDVLRGYPSGINLNTLKENLEKKHGFDLEAFSQKAGYGDIILCLLAMPGLHLSFWNGQQPHDYVITLLSSGHAVPHLPHSSENFLDKDLSSSESNLSQELVETKPKRSVCTSKNSNQDELVKKPGRRKKEPCTANPVKISRDYVALTSCDGSAHPGGHQVSCPWNDLEDISKPAFTFSDSSTSDPQPQSLPAPAAVIPPEVNNLFHINKPTPFSTLPNFSLFQEPHNALSVKAKSSSVSPSSVVPEQPNTFQFGSESLTEEIPNNSHLTTFERSTGLDELKQQVAHILTMHPEGMSLFQFRAAYSATFEQHFPVGSAASAKQRLLEMRDIVCLKGHGVQVLLLPVSSGVSPVKSGQPASSKVENIPVVSSLASVKPVSPAKSVSVLKTLQPHSTWTLPLESLGKPEGKDCCIPKDLSLSVPWQEEEKPRTNFTVLSDQPDLSKGQKVPVLLGHSLPKDEPPEVPQSCLKPVIPQPAVMPVPKPRCSLLQSSESIRAAENKGNRPCIKLHPQAAPGSVNTVQEKIWTSPKLTKIPFTPHSSTALSTPSQGTVCGENLQPDIKSRPASLTNSEISDNSLLSPSSFVTWQEPVNFSPATLYPGNSVQSVDPAPVPLVSVNLSGIHFPRSTSQSDCAQSILPVQTLYPALSTEQRNSNHTRAELEPFSPVQKQSRALQHSLSSDPDSSAERHSVSSLPRNSASCFLPSSQPDHQVQQHTCVRLGDLHPGSVSLADNSLTKTSLGRVYSAATFKNKFTYVNPLEISSTIESFSTCSSNEPLQSLQASSATTNNSITLSSVSSSRTKAVSLASSPLESTINSSDQFACASAKVISNSNPLMSESISLRRQRQSASAAAYVISNRKTPSSTSLPKSTTSSSHQFAYDSSRITTNSSALSSEAYAFTHQRWNAQAKVTKTGSSTSPLGSTTDLSGHYAFPSAKITSSSNVLSSETCAFTHLRKYGSATATTVSSRTTSGSKTPSPLKYASYHSSSAAFSTSLNHGSPSKYNFVSSLSKPGDHSSASWQEKQVPYYSVPQNSHPPKSNDKCLIL